MFKQINIDDVLKLKDISIIDIRSSQKYNDNHILHALNIPYDILISNPDKYLLKTKEYYIYCQKGIQSKKACQLLNSRGYHLINIIGGYEAFILNN